MTGASASTSQAVASGSVGSGSACQLVGPASPDESWVALSSCSPSSVAGMAMAGGPMEKPANSAASAAFENSEGSSSCAGPSDGEVVHGPPASLTMRRPRDPFAR